MRTIRSEFLVNLCSAFFRLQGFKLQALKLFSPSRELLEAHYADLSKKGFFAGMITTMMSGPVCCMVWEGLGAVATGRVVRNRWMSFFLSRNIASLSRKPSRLQANWNLRKLTARYLMSVDARSNQAIWFCPWNHQRRLRPRRRKVIKYTEHQYFINVAVLAAR